MSLSQSVLHDGLFPVTPVSGGLVALYRRFGWAPTPGKDRFSGIGSSGKNSGPFIRDRCLGNQSLAPEL